MKKLISVFVSFCILFSMVQMTLGLSVSAGGNSLTPAQIAAKNYPIPENFELSQVFTLDSSGCTESGCFYDTASKKITSNNNNYTNALPSNAKLDGNGFMFWYKSTDGATIRLRNTTNNSIVLEATLSANSGCWVKYYYHGVNGSWENISPKSDATKDIRSLVSDNEVFMLTLTNKSSGTTYVDEFLTFKSITTAADSYDNNSQAFKFAASRYEKSTKTNASYIASEGAVELTSEYGETTSNTPISITYGADSAQFATAVALAKQGTGYLKINVSNISCQNSSGNDAYANIVITFGGIDKSINDYSYGAGTNDDFLLNVADLENPENITTITVAVKGSSIKNVDFKFSEIIVYERDSSYTYLEAEDLNGVFATSRNATPTALSTVQDGGKNRTYVNVASSTNSTAYVEFTLPQLSPGVYQLGAAVYMTTTKGTFIVSVNNINNVYGVELGDSTYASRKHNSFNDNICSIRITKKYSDGPSKLKFTVTPKKNQTMCVDYFTLVKTSSLTAEPSSNFTIKDYPEMQDYEVKKILDKFDTFICSTDERYYNPNNSGGNYVKGGYVGDGNAFNLNSHGTINGGGGDANTIVSGAEGFLDGDGVRFWYKSSNSFTLRFATASSRAEVTVPANSSGGWYSVYYKNISGVSIDNVKQIILKGGTVYLDEIHTIQEKEGNVVYSISGNTACVSGYHLRLEDVEILSTYQGLPVTSIAAGALSGSSTLKSVTIPSSVTSIGDEAFSGCKKLQTVNLGSQITSIGTNAFNNCTSLLADVANNSVAKTYVINNGVNYKCNNGSFEYKKIGDNVQIIRYVGDAVNVTVPSTIDGVAVNSILENAFKDNTEIVSVSMSSVTSIGDGAFSGCTSLASVNLGESITTIGSKAFENVTSLDEITLPESVTSIANDTFKNCYDSIIANVVKDSYAYTYVNTKATAMTQIPTTSSTFKYSLYRYEATVIGYTGSATIISIPETIDGYNVIAVGEGAFKNNKTITYVSFSDKCKRIYKEAFRGCSALTGFNINKIVYIGHLGFAYCTSLGNITLTNISKYENDTFLGCHVTISINTVQFARSAKDLTDTWKAGINLGNIFDWAWTSSNPTYHGWDKNIPTKITKARIDFITSSGFDVIRFPITWLNYVDDSNNYKIDDDYLSAIKDIVDYAIADDAYIIINVHHDTLDWLNLNNYGDAQIEKFTAIWEQIADYFKDYDEHLIFESLNEERYGSDWDGNGSSGGSDLFNKFNTIQKAFYDTVRATGGYNNTRYLMFETYGAQAKSNHCQRVWVPSVSEDDHVMMSLHYYNDNIGENYFNAKFNCGKTYFVDQGIPCVMGETARQRVNLYDNNNLVYEATYNSQNQSLYEWTKAVFTSAKNYDQKVILWEDGGYFGMINHYELRWDFPLEIKGMQEVVYPEGEEEEPITDLSVQLIMNSGASIRLGTVNGIRFTTQVDVVKLEELREAGYTVEIGTLIGPENSVGDELNYEDYDNGKAVKVPYTSSEYYNGTANVIAGSLINILEKTKSNPVSGNITRDFIGRGYAKVTDKSGNTVYSYASYYNEDVSSNTRSVAYISNMYKNDANSSYNQLPENYMATVDRWAGFYGDDNPPYSNEEVNDPSVDDVF